MPVLERVTVHQQTAPVAGSAVSIMSTRTTAGVRTYSSGPPPWASCLNELCYSANTTKGLTVACCSPSTRKREVAGDTRKLINLLRAAR